MRPVLVLLAASYSALGFSQSRPTPSSRPPSTPRPAVRSENPGPAIRPSAYLEISALAEMADQKSVPELWKLVHEAYNRHLYGMSRQFARRVLQLDPEHAKARAYLGYTRVATGSSSEWLDSYEMEMRRAGKFRDPSYGWIAETDRAALTNGQLRGVDGHMLKIAALDAAHTTWAKRRTVRGRFFDVTGCMPLEVMWYVADDLDAFVQTYCDFFELPSLPKTRFTAHLYRTFEDAQAAGANRADDRGPWITRYKAYFENGIVHVMFESPNAVGAVRHEAAHALNRVYISRLPQWLDEGIGAYCQFLHAGADQQLEFGHFSKREFALKFIEEVREGREEQLQDIARAKLVTMNTHYYSKFRAIVDFFLLGADQRYRGRFVNAVFRQQGTLEELLALPGVNEQWLAYVKSLRPTPDFRYVRDPQRAQAIQQLLRTPATTTSP